MKKGAKKKPLATPQRQSKRVKMPQARKRAADVLAARGKKAAMTRLKAKKRKSAPRADPAAAVAEQRPPGYSAAPLHDGQHERFCQLMARGIFSNYSCYLQVYPDSTASAARSSSSDLLTKPNIQGRIEWLRKRAAEGVIFEIQDGLKFLVDVIKTPVGYLDDESPLTQEVQRDITGTEEEGVVTKVKIKMPAKMDAMKLLADIKGWKKSDEQNQKQTNAVVDLVAWIRNGGNKVPKGTS